MQFLINRRIIFLSYSEVINIIKKYFMGVEKKYALFL